MIKLYQNFASFLGQKPSPHVIWLLSYFKGSKKFFLSIALMVPFIGAIEAGFIYLVKDLLQHGFGNHQALMSFLRLGLLLVVAKLSLQLLYSKLLLERSSSITARLRQEVFSKVLALDYQNSQSYNKSSILTELLTGLNDIAHFLSQFLIELLKNIVVITSIIIMMCYLSFSLTLSLIIVMPFMYLVFKMSKKKVTSYQTDLLSLSGGVQSQLLDVFNANDVINGYSAGKTFNDKFNNVNTSLKKKTIKLNFMGSLSKNITELLFSMPLFIIIFMITIGHYEITLPVFTAVLAGARRLKAPMSSFSSMQIQINKALIGAKLLHQFMQHKEVHYGHHIHQPFKNLSINCLSFSYDKKLVPACTIQSLSIKAQERIMVLGSSGSGKSTFLKLLSGLYQKASGDCIYLNQYPIVEYTQLAKTKLLGYASQNHIIFKMSLIDNITLGSSFDERRFAEVCHLACINDFIESLPHKGETLLGDGSTELSGGQQQRVMLARLLYANTDILLCDEITSALDVHTEQRVMNGLLKLSDKTIIFVTHKLSLVEHFDRVILFSEGKIVADGSHDDLLMHNASYQQFYIQYRDEESHVVAH